MMEVIYLEKEILTAALSQGIWAVLSVFLLFYILKAQEKRDIKQDEREKNYQQIITQITDKLNIVEDVKNDVKEIKNIIQKTI